MKGNLSSNSIETVRAAVLADVGVGLVAKLSFSDVLQNPEITTILDDFLSEVIDVSLVWPRRRFVPARVRRVTDFFAEALAHST